MLYYVLTIALYCSSTLAFETLYEHDAKTVYCWRFNKSILSKTVKEEDILSSGVGKECPIQISNEKANYNEVKLRKIQTKWQLQITPGFLQTPPAPNALGMKKLLKGDKGFDIPHSNIHFCQFGSNCSPFKSGVGDLTSTVNQRRDFDPNSNIASYQAQIQFNMAGVFSIVSHVYMKGPNNTRYDFAVYSKGDISLTDAITTLPHVKTPSPQLQKTKNIPHSISEEKSYLITYVLIGAGVFVMVLVFIVILFVLRKRRREGGPKRGNNRHDEEHLAFKCAEDNVIGNSQLGTGTSECIINIEGEEFLKSGELPFWKDSALLTIKLPGTLTYNKKIYNGAIGEVWKGEYGNKTVAIKCSHRNRQTPLNDLQKFAQEIKLMSSFDHPQIVSFIGVYWYKPEDISAVIEYMPAGDLRVMLDTSQMLTTWNISKLQIAADTVNALVYLHSFQPTILHRDLKSKNILLDVNLRAKLSDFGISRKHEIDRNMTQSIGTALWMAPEVLNGENYNEKVDIYSFGVILLELDSGKMPFDHVTSKSGCDMSSDFKKLQLVSEGKITFKWTKNCPKTYIKLAEACMDLNPSRRPTAMEAFYILNHVVRDELCQNKV